MIDWRAAFFSVVVACTLWLLLSGCASNGDPRAELAGEFAIIEGHLAAVPQEKLGGRRIVIYLGDAVLPPTPPGEDQLPPERLQNIRKAVSASEAERRYLRDLISLLAGDPKRGTPGWKVGAEGPVLRLYGEHPKGRWGEHVQGIDFVFCFAEYIDPITKRATTVDVCHGGRLHDKALRAIGEKAFGAVKKGGDIFNPLD